MGARSLRPDDKVLKDAPDSPGLAEKIKVEKD